MGKEINTKTKRVSARITDEMDREFEEIAAAQNLSKSEITRSLIEIYIRRYEESKE